MHIDAKIYAKDFFLSQTVVFERVASPPKPRLSSLSKSNCKTSMKSNTFLKEIYLLSRVCFRTLSTPRHICLIEKRLPLSVYLRTNVHGTLDKTGKKHRLNNGAIYEVASFKRDGGIELNNGWVVPKDYGHFNHGYVTTSHASQGKTVDKVLIAQSSQSFGASSQEQFYVSVSRGRKGVEVFTDDKELLKEQIKSG